MTTIAAVKKRGKVLTEEEVKAMIRDSQKEMSLRTYAKELGISVAYLSDIYNGLRNPGDKILKSFRIRKTRRVIVEYQLE